MTWDTVVSIKQLLDGYTEATGNSYLLVVAQGDESTARVIAKAMAGVPAAAGPSVLFEMEAAAASVFDEIADHLGVFDDDEGDDEGEPQA